MNAKVVSPEMLNEIITLLKGMKDLVDETEMNTKEYNEYLEMSNEILTKLK